MLLNRSCYISWRFLVKYHWKRNFIRSLSLSSSQQLPRQARWKPDESYDPVDIKISEGLAVATTTAAVTGVNRTSKGGQHPRSKELHVLNEKLNKSAIKTNKIKSKVNPMVVKYTKMLNDMIDRNHMGESDETGETEYVYATNFGSIRFDKDNIPSEILNKLCIEPEENMEKDEKGSDLNLIDQQYFGGSLNYTSSNVDTNTTNEKLEHTQSHDTVSEGVNFIDELYFGNHLDRDIKQNEASQLHSETTANISIHSKQDINDDKDLNYIDEVFFKDPPVVIEDADNNPLVTKDADNNYRACDVDPSECKSDFERALLDYDDGSRFEAHPTHQLGPHTQKIEQEIEQEYKEKMANFKMKRSDEDSIETSIIKKKDINDTIPVEENDIMTDTINVSPPREDTMTNTINVSPPREDTMTNTINVSPPREDFFSMKQEIPEATKVNNAFEFVLEMRRKVKQEEMRTDEEKGAPLPAYKNIISAVWDLTKSSRSDIIQLLHRTVLYNENEIVAIYKPYGLQVQDGGSRSGSYKHHCLDDLLPELCTVFKVPALHRVHRLDINTTGVLLFATTETMAATLRQMFKDRRALKTYLTITRGIPSPLQGVIDIPIVEALVQGRRKMTLRPVLADGRQRPVAKGSRAITKYKVLTACHHSALVSVHPMTGVKHQVRAHLGLGLSCPILADHKYTTHGSMAPQKLPGDMLERLQMKQSRVRDLPMVLHAASVTLPELLDGRNLRIDCPPPPHFTKTMKLLKLNSRRNVVNMPSLGLVDIGVALV